MKNSKVNLLVSCQIKMMEHFPREKNGGTEIERGCVVTT